MKKILSLVLALAMLMSIGLTANAETASSDVFRYDETVTLKISVFDRGNAGGTAPDSNYYTQWIQENFGDPRNIKIEWTVIPRSEEVAKLNILMASGEAPDLCFTYDGSVVSNFVAQGGLVELSDLLDQYGPNIKALLGDQVINAGRYDGGLYAIPARRVVIATQGMFIREDWLEKLGLEMPTTKEEFLNVLRAFRDNDMDGDGDPSNEIPYAMGSDLRGHEQLKLSFFDDLSDRTIACMAWPSLPGYKDYALFLNQMYNEGLISPDFALDTSDLLYNDITAGKAGGYTYNYDHPIRVSPGILSALQTYEPDAKLSVLNCFESVTDPTKYYHAMYAAYGLMNFIPVYSQHPEAAMMYLDWLCEYDTIYFLQNGVEGITYDLNEDGIPVVKTPDDDNHDKTFNSMQNIDYTLLINGQWLDSEEKLMKAQSLSYQGYADLYEPMYIVGNTDPITTNWHFETVLSADAQYTTSLVAFEKELLTKVTMAKPEEASALFDQLLAQYMSMGGQAVQDEKLAAWDAAHAE
ncbi:MAG: extracellular solute-binding protein [Aristaeellaceae bacterium]